MGAGNHPRTRKAQERGPRRGGKGHHGKRHDPHPGRAYHDGGTSAAPPPPNTPRLPGAHPPTRTAEASIGRRTDHTSAPAATRATSQAPEEDKGGATATRARDRNPQRTRDQGTGPQGGQPHGRLPNPPARAARPGPHSTDPARHPHLTPQPPASHTPARTPHHDTGQADLH